MLTATKDEAGGARTTQDVAGGVPAAGPAQSGPVPAAAARNACKLCAPLGACVVFSGIAGCVPFLHGSQGCATYIRRYLISHFREPVDIGSSSFSEEDTVFGGARNLKAGLANIAAQYHPEAIGVATTCLAETIGEDVPRILDEFTKEAGQAAPPLVHVSTPSYVGTHIEGFHATVLSVTRRFARAAAPHNGVNLLPGFVSPEDLRHLKELCRALELPAVLVPDYSETLDGQSWSEYHRIQGGGTPLESMAAMSGARATFEFGRTLARRPETAATWLAKEFHVPALRLGLPIGLRETDRFFEELERVAGRRLPEEFHSERGRLIDAMVDGHKYLFGKRAVVYGEADLVAGLVSFLTEIGVRPVLCATGSKSGGFAATLWETAGDTDLADLRVLEGADHAQIGHHARELKPDLLIGSSKGYPVARELGAAMVRVGFPIHDRLGGQRVPHLGYRGAQRLLDQIVNTLLERRQDESDVGYSYL